MGQNEDSEKEKWRRFARRGLAVLFGEFFSRVLEPGNEARKIPNKTLCDMFNDEVSFNLDEASFPNNIINDHMSGTQKLHGGSTLLRQGEVQKVVLDNYAQTVTKGKQSPASQLCFTLDCLLAFAIAAGPKWLNDIALGFKEETLQINAKLKRWRLGLTDVEKKSLDMGDERFMLLLQLLTGNVDAGQESMNLIANMLNGLGDQKNTIQPSERNLATEIDTLFGEPMIAFNEGKHATTAARSNASKRPGHGGNRGGRPKKAKASDVAVSGSGGGNKAGAKPKGSVNRRKQVAAEPDPQDAAMATIDGDGEDPNQGSSGAQGSG